MTTDFESKAQQVIEEAYRALGGSGSNPDVPQFKSQLSNASPSQIAQADELVWKGITQPQCEQGGQPLQSNVLQQVSALAERMHQTLIESGARSRT